MELVQGSSSNLFLFPFSTPCSSVFLSKLDTSNYLWQNFPGISFNLAWKVLPGSSHWSPHWMFPIAYQASSRSPVGLCPSTASLTYPKCPFQCPLWIPHLLAKVIFCLSSNIFCFLSLFFFAWKVPTTNSIWWIPIHLFKEGIVTERLS